MGAVLWILFSFKGRLGRAEFWVGILISIIFGCIISYLSKYVAGYFLFHGNPVANVSQLKTLIHSQDFTKIFLNITVIEVTTIVVLNLWISLALLTKRLHDLGINGFWPIIVIFVIVPLLATAASKIDPRGPQIIAGAFLILVFFFSGKSNWS